MGNILNVEEYLRTLQEVGELIGGNLKVRITERGQYMFFFCELSGKCTVQNL